MRKEIIDEMVPLLVKLFILRGASETEKEVYRFHNKFNLSEEEVEYMFVSFKEQYLQPSVKVE